MLRIQPIYKKKNISLEIQKFLLILTHLLMRNTDFSALHIFFLSWYHIKLEQ